MFKTKSIDYPPSTIVKVLRFFIAGMPAFILAMLLNVFLVEYLEVHKLIAYTSIIFIQVTINFYAAILLVFDRDSTKSIKYQYTQFVLAILFVRLIDWAIYGMLVEIFNYYYLLVQLGNVFIFSSIKFILARRILEAKN